MKPVWLVVQRELRERIGARSFRFFSLGLLLLAAATIVAIDQAPAIFDETTFTLGVVGEQPDGLEAALDQFAEARDVTVETRLTADRDDAEALLEDGQINAFLDQDELVYKDAGNGTLTAVVNRALYVARLPQALAEAGVTAEEAQTLLDPEPLEVRVLTPDGEDEGERQFLGFVAALAFYVTMAVYGNWILTGVVEEKSSRIVEVLLGLLRPHEILTGKTLGIVLVALLQLSMALLGAGLGLLLSGTDVLPAIALDMVVFGVPLYLMGVLLYSLLYAAVGSTVTRQADAQAAATPIVMLLLVPYMFAAVFVPQNPDGAAATFMSLLPLTAPLVMPARIASGSPSPVEYVLCYGLMLPAVAFAAWLGGRIYSGSILSSRRSSLFSVLRSAFSSKSREAPTI
jgi:ABC-2 type transport system permease protein